MQIGSLAVHNMAAGCALVHVITLCLRGDMLHWWMLLGDCVVCVILFVLTSGVLFEVVFHGLERGADVLLLLCWHGRGTLMSGVSVWQLA